MSHTKRKETVCNDTGNIFRPFPSWQQVYSRKSAEAIFTACGFFAVLAVASITLYMIFSGTPALFKVGILDILFGTLWQPAAATPSFGILYVILTSIVGTFLAILIGVPVGVMTAVFLAEVAPKNWQM